MWQGFFFGGVFFHVFIGVKDVRDLFQMANDSDGAVGVDVFDVSGSEGRPGGRKWGVFTRIQNIKM